jgi:platelet-activating factor acetylhydrolase
MKEGVTPVIYSHGLSSNRTMHSGTCRDMASQGFMVMALDHMDLSSSYYESVDGKGYWYSNEHDSHDLEYRTKQLDIRVKEVISLINILFDPDTLEHLLRVSLRFPADFHLDLSSLTLSGHSFGGMTAIDTARLDPRVSLVLTMDPWLFCRHHLITSGSYYLSQPHLAVST